MLPSSGGRPSRAYTLSSAGHELFPKQYALFSRMLLKSMEETLKEEELQKLLHTMGQEMAAPFKARVKDSDDQIEEARKIMEELGYETSPRTPSTSSEIIAKNCVYHDIAMKNESVCILDRSIISTFTRGRSRAIRLYG